MKMLKIYSAMMMLLVASGIMDVWAAGPRRAWSESDGVFYLKTSDGLEEYTVNGTITFRAAAEGSTIPTYRDCGVVFSPANEGEVLQIKVNSIDLSGENYLLLYDGAIEKIGYGVGTGDQSSYLPDGYVKWYTSGSAGETYTSTSSDGKLSFGFHSQRPEGQTGFDITVTSMPLKDMEYRSTSVVTGLSSVNRGAKNQVIFGVNVVTDGGSNALTLNKLSIDCSALKGSTQVTNVRLYRGEVAASGDLLATASTVGDNLTASDVTLKNGNNRFVVVADVLPDASGAIPSVALSQVTVAGNDCTPQTTTGEAVTVDNVILMTSKATTFTISDAAAFYDDGGVDGKIGSKFTGTITFVPATQGHAIKVDFSKFAIFNTSSVGYNDIFKFYNGRTADESNLITTLLEEAETVKSTAEDGSMTITLTSTTGVPADGWEAVVSQFLPGDMTLSGVTAQAASEATVAAGDTAVVLLVDVQTDNQSNALSLTGLNLQTAQADLLDKVSVYYLGKKSTLSTTNLFGEASVSGSEIAISGNQELIEGHNYLAVVATVNEAALNGNQVSLSLKQATVGGNQVAPSSEVTATRTVANICHATQGSHSHKMYDAWTFTDTKSSIYPSKYEFENANYIVTFTPAEAGMVAQLDFSAFDVTYSSSSYGTKAVFEVYSGTSVNSANLLWSLSDASQATTGPGKTLRSTAADGSMTIRFNPNTTSSYYAATGWMATVQPFKNHEMTIDSITVNQTSTDVVAVGATDVQVIDFDVVTEGTLTTTTIKQVNLDLKGCEQLLDKVTVLYNNVNDYSSAVAFGSVSAPTTSEIAVNGERALAEGHNYWWVTADVKADAASEQQIDAKLVSLVDANGNVTAVAAGDPEGYRLTKNQYLMTADTTVITVTNPLMFYDDGGPDENYSKGFKGVTIFVPGVEGYAVTMNSVSFGTGSGKFYLYHGSEVNSDNLVKSPYYSATTGPANIISKAEDGALTVKFEGSTYSTTSGWAIDVRLHELTPFVVDSIIAEPATTAEVMRGATDAPIVKGTIVVSGDRGTLQVNNLTFSTEGTTNLSNIKAAKLYYTGKGANFVPNNLIATVTDLGQGSVTFTLDQPIEITDNGNFYFWITYDVNRNASAGNVVAATLTSTTVDGQPATVKATQAQRTIKTGMRGTYVIGASEAADFATFAEATQALNEGIEGAVTFEVEDGTYAENVKVQGVEGAGPSSTITFIGQSGDASKVVITGSGNVDQGYGSHKEGMFMIDSTSYVSVRDLSLVPSTQDYPYAMHIYNQSRHVTIDGVIITAQTVTSGYSGMALVKSEAKNEEGKNNDFLTIQNSQFTGGYIALYLGGTGYIALTREQGLTVRNNVVNEAGSKAIYVTDEDDMIIDGNSTMASLTTKNDYHGLDLYRCRGAFEVKNNTVVNAMSAYSCGIELRSECRGRDDMPGRVYNNAVSITNSPSNSATGIEIGADCRNIHLTYNTVRIDGKGGYTYYTSRSNSATYTNMRMQNNLLQNLTGSPAMFIYGSDYVHNIDFERNAFYAADSVIIDGYTLDAFNTLVGNATSLIDSAQFVSATDLRLKQAGNLRSAQPVDYIATDITGRERDLTAPTIGAYEYAAIDSVAPAIVEGYPVVVSVGETDATVKTAWNVSGNVYTIVVKQGEDAPTLDQLLATTAQAYTTGSELSSHYTGLEPATSYVAYFVIVSALDGQTSAIVASEVFTTLRHIEPLAIDLARPYDMIDHGASTTIQPEITGGDRPYTYEWRDQMNQVVGTDSTLTVSPDYTWGYRLTVTSADGQTVTAKTGVWVAGECVTATFDDNWVADDPGYFNGDYEGDVFYSGSFAFNVSNMDYWWYGYALSSQTDTAYRSLSDQYRSIAGGGVDGTQFSAAFPNGLTVDVTNDLEGSLVAGMMVTNSAYAYHSMAYGDSFARKFAQGDWFMLTVTGTHADGSTSQIDYYLADLRSEDAAQHRILSDWQWVDLSPLGVVTNLRFTLSSSDVGKWGMNTPAYFCLDNLGCTDPSLDPTGITPSLADAAEVVSVTYCNTQGMTSDRPFDGINIVVTTYADGSHTTQKVIYRK